MILVNEGLKAGDLEGVISKKFSVEKKERSIVGL